MRLFFVRSEAGEADILFASDEKAIAFGIDSGLSWGVRLTPLASGVHRNRMPLLSARILTNHGLLM